MEFKEMDDVIDRSYGAKIKLMEKKHEMQITVLENKIAESHEFAIKV